MTRSKTEEALLTPPEDKCRYVDADHVVPGWGCCMCRHYNGLQRGVCRGCGHPRCKPLSPDKETGKVFESYREAKWELFCAKCKASSLVNDSVEFRFPAIEYEGKTYSAAKEPLPLCETCAEWAKGEMRVKVKKMTREAEDTLSLIKKMLAINMAIRELEVARGLSAEERKIKVLSLPRLRNELSALTDELIARQVSSQPFEDQFCTCTSKCLKHRSDADRAEK